MASFPLILTPTVLFRLPEEWGPPRPLCTNHGSRTSTSTPTPLIKGRRPGLPPAVCTTATPLRRSPSPLYPSFVASPDPFIAAMSLLSDLVNLNLTDSTEKIIAEYIWYQSPLLLRVRRRLFHASAAAGFVFFGCFLLLLRSLSWCSLAPIRLISLVVHF